MWQKYRISQFYILGTNPYRVGKGDYGCSNDNNKEWFIRKMQWS